MDENLIDKKVDFKDYNTVRNVILNKQEIVAISKFQETNLLKESSTNGINIELNEYVKEIYDMLDKYICRIKIKDKNKKMLSLLLNGERIKELALELNMTETGIHHAIRRCVKKINKVALDDGE